MVDAEYDLLFMLGKKLLTAIEITRHDLLYLLFLAGSFLNFLPQICGYSLKDPDSNAFPAFLTNLSSLHYQGSVIASLSSTVPILVDNFLSLFFRDEQFDTIHVIPFREVILLLIIPDLLFILWIVPYGQYDYMAGLIGARDTMFIFSLLSYVKNLKNPIWTELWTISISFSFMAANIFASTGTQILDPKNALLSASNVLLPFFVSIGLLLLIIATGRWIHFCITVPTADKSDELRNRVCSLYVFFGILFILADWLIFYFPLDDFPDWTNIGANYLTLYTYMMAFCVLMITALTNRICRLDANEGKMLMRYISHEIRTPLNILNMGLKLLYAEMLEQNNKECLETVTESQESCEIAVGLLNEVLLFDKAQSGLLVLEKENIAPIQFVNSALSPFAVQARASDVTLNFQSTAHPEQNSLYLHADRGKLAQVIRNLVSNALKFTKSGSVDVQVKIISLGSSLSLRDRDESFHEYACLWPKRRTLNDVKPINCATDVFVLSVTDTGAGISLENQQRLFKGIVQFNPGKLQGGQGTGLGLYISKKIMDMHGGTITVSSDGEGRGSTFTITLPLVRVEEGENSLGPLTSTEIPKLAISMPRNISTKSLLNGEKKSVRNSSPHQGSLSRSSYIRSSIETIHSDVLISESDDLNGTVPYEEEFPAVKILVVDDSDLNRRMVCKMLRKRGAICEEAADGSVAVDMINTLIDSPYQQPSQLLSARAGKYKVLNFNTKDEEALFAQKVDEGIRLHDVILMDYEMPHMDGPTAIKEIRRIGYKGLVVGLTGHGGKDETDILFAAGADKVLLKPFYFELFWSFVSER